MGLVVLTSRIAGQALGEDSLPEDNDKEGKEPPAVSSDPADGGLSVLCEFDLQ